jgi:20S proteasome alpha/beta subunit
MTVAIGFNCHDGIVLCTDSLESDGAFKSKVNKIWCYETQGEWGIAVASAGDGDFIESFTSSLKELFTGEHWDELWIMSTLRTAINAARTSYPDLDWEALFSIFGPSPMDRKLLRVTYKGKHLAPVSRYEALGIGGTLAKYLSANMYNLFMGVDEASELGVFIVHQCTQYIEACDLPISLLSWKIGQTGWSPSHPTDVQKLVERLPLKKVRESMLTFWTQNTPHFDSVRLNPVYKDLQQGGFVQFTRALGLKPYRANAKSQARQRPSSKGK